MWQLHVLLSPPCSGPLIVVDFLVPQFNLGVASPHFTLSHPILLSIIHAISSYYHVVCQVCSDSHADSQL